MNKDSYLVVGYYNCREEQDKINNGIINEVKMKSLKEGLKQGIQQAILQNQKEMVINMYNKKYTLNDIDKVTNLSVEEIKEIINQEM